MLIGKIPDRQKGYSLFREKICFIISIFIILQDLSVIECGGLYGRGLTFDPVQLSCEDEKKVWFKILGVADLP